jgi:hypothetical protein
MGEVVMKQKNLTSDEAATEKQKQEDRWKTER